MFLIFQQKAFQEQQIIFQDKETDTATYADLQNMKYLEKVIKESLRLYPSVPVYGRETNEEVQFGICFILKCVFFIN
jgi:cytochrome P450 family 4